MNSTFKPRWLVHFNAHLVHNFGITIKDSGHEPDDIFTRWGHLDPQSAVWSFGAKYDLDPIPHSFELA